MAELNWRTLVRDVRDRKLEPADQHGVTRFMFWPDPAVFISDPHLIAGVHRARGHSKSFVLVGEQNTGKNIFLRLVTRRDPAIHSTPFVDENVFGEEEDDLKKFFGKAGVVDRNRAALIHFDFMERAVTWNRFVEKLHHLAIGKTLERLDGEVIECPDLRVVLRANRVPSDFGQGSLFAHLYLSLSDHQYSTTRRVSEQPERLEAILTEMLAARVLQGLSEEQAAKLESVSSAVLAGLRDHPLPNDFSGLRALVSNASTMGDWDQALEKTRSMNPAMVKVDLPGERVESLRDFLDANLRKAVFDLPTKEREIQNAVEQLLIGRGLKKGIDYDREVGRVRVSIKEVVPDFILPNLSLALEVKLAKTDMNARAIVDEINADIRSYGKCYTKILFVVYDLGTIRDTLEFTRDFEAVEGVDVIVVKH